MTQQPARIQRRRTKGWRKPEGAIYVGRGTRWGNPCTQIRMPALDGSAWEHEGRLGKTSGQQHAFVHPDKTITWHLVQDATREQATEMYRRWLDRRPDLAEAARTELVGRDLMCWCPLPEPGQPDHCHAAVLLDLANQTAPYCTGDRCTDCTPDEECCEATCGCCPRVNEHDHCWLHEGSDDDSKRCSQHGEGSLLPRSPKAQAMYDLLRRA